MFQDQNEHNPIKSIIYGNQVKNPYGNFRAFCAAILHHEQIDKIITYLRTNQKFQKYNRFTYAFRVYEYKLSSSLKMNKLKNHLKYKDDSNSKNRIIEGYNEDQTLEGSGEKLLHLLQKFNVENVLIVSAIEQYDPLNKFETTHFRIIVERAKDLLNNLYSRVVQSEQEGTNNVVKFQSGSLLTRIIKVPVKLNTTKIEVPQINQQARFARSQDKQQNRPNHFYSEGKPSFLQKAKKSNNSELQPQINSSVRKVKELNSKLKNSAYSLEKILLSLNEREYLQLKFIVKYDQNKLVEKVLNLLMILIDVSSRDKLAHDYDFQVGLENMTVNDLDDIKVRKINEILRGDQRLNVYQLAESNPLVSTLFAFIMLLVKSYESGKQLIKLQSFLQQDQDKYNQEKQQLQEINSADEYLIQET